MKSVCVGGGGQSTFTIPQKRGRFSYAEKGGAQNILRYLQSRTHEGVMQFGQIWLVGRVGGEWVESRCHEV